MGTREDINKDSTSFNLEKTSNRKSKYSNFGQKTSKFGIFVSTILCHRYCRSGSGTSYGALKLKTRVWRMYTQVLCALDWPQRSSGGGRGMIICLNDAQMTHRWRKGLIFLLSLHGYHLLRLVSLTIFFVGLRPSLSCKTDPN